MNPKLIWLKAVDCIHVAQFRDSHVPMTRVVKFEAPKRAKIILCN